MRTLNDIDDEDEFYICAYTTIDTNSRPTEGLAINEYKIDKKYTKDFFFILRNNHTQALKEIENCLQTLCTRNNKTLLTAMINIDLAIGFVEDAMSLIDGFNKEHMRTIFFDMLNYLHDAKKLGSNEILFEGYELIV